MTLPGPTELVTPPASTTHSSRRRRPRPWPRRCRGSREFSGATVVVKYGGNAMVDPVLQQSFAADVVSSCAESGCGRW